MRPFLALVPRCLALAVPLVFLLAAVGSGLSSPAPAAPRQEDRSGFQKAMQDGNYRDAYAGFRALALAADTDPRTVGSDLQNAVQCLQHLNELKEIDALLEDVIEVHRENWRLLRTAAQVYQSLPHYGFIVAGAFERGHHRGEGNVANAEERDRVRALQLMVEARELVLDEPASAEIAGFYTTFAQVVLGNRGYQEAWRLQYLTDLSTLPDYEEGWGYHYYGGQTRGAPVDENGQPVYYGVPESWEAAANDGERWRWMLHRAAEVHPPFADQVRFTVASFFHQQLGVQTLHQYGYFFRTHFPEDDDAGDGGDTSGTYALHTLAENETIARLAVGIRRFTLPEEFDFVRMFRQLADEESSYASAALDTLAGIFENRRQYPKAAALWERSVKAFGPQDWRQQRLQQIVGNWGRFETGTTQAAGEGAKLEYRFRNGRQVELRAHEIKHRELLADVKAYIKSAASGRLDWSELDIENIGQRLVQEGGDEYLGRQVAEWSLELEPLPDHFDRRITVTTPLQKAGAYLLTARMADGNESRIVVWLSDTVIVKKPLDRGALYYVADAVTGEPLARANLELFGYSQESVGRNQYRVVTQNFAEHTDENGQVVHEAGRDDGRYRWIATATTEDGRFAYLGYTNVWQSRYRELEYNQVKAFAITDRPVYRPEQTVQFKFWVRYAQYDQENVSQFANKPFRVEIHDPKGEKIFDESRVTDEWGGLDGEYRLAQGATLGLYSIRVSGHGGTQFRVEEYKKPEFEVTIDAPSEPVELGEKISATINAKYYFGSPVSEATVKYRVLRTSYTQEWYPPSPWDWLYGPGYWWFGYDYVWYRGWEEWGCRRPYPWWWTSRTTPPEVIAEVETRVGPDGSVNVEIDSAVARELHPDQDHRYEIIAEVVDASRRTIVGRGEVLVARRPFKVFAWLDRGYYRVGETVEASFAARTVDGKPVEGEGKVTLYRIRYDDEQKPVETAVFEQDLPTNPEGRARAQLAASEKGQYRVAYRLTDAKGHTIEGAYVFTIVGEGFDGAEFRFNDVELLTDRREYAPGDTAALQVNTNRARSSVLLFIRPSNGVYLPPRLVKLTGKSSLVDVAITQKDMPNFFVEALTVAGGRVHTVVREIHVPPVKRVLDVAVTPALETCKPGARTAVKVRLTDLFGEPFVGSTVISVYDKAVEYISGGSNVAAIKDFFWKWRRHHGETTETSLQRYFPNLVLPDTVAMGDLGIFGDTVADELEEGDRALLGQAAGAASGRERRMAVTRASAAAPGAPAESAEAAKSEGLADDAGGGGALGGEAGGDLVQPTVRTEFADTALWVAALTTGADGTAEIELDMPENLTTWKVKVWGMGHGTTVGEGVAEIITRKDLILRLQAPRFFVQTDEVVLSANVHNYLSSAKRVEVALELDGGTLEPLGDLTRTVEIEADGEARVDWRVRVIEEGEAVVRMLALTDEESDAMEMRFPVYVHGMLKMDSFSGSLRPEDESGVVTMRVPEDRRPEETRLEVRYSPTLAGAMVDALPYLVEYPYGCTEQTLNRFLPTVITQKVLLDMGLDLAAIREKRTNLNAQEIGDDRARAAGWKRYSRNPVFDEEEVRRMVKEGVKALTEMQLSDGGWGWFSGYGEHSYPHTTAVVVHGLQVAAANDVALVPGVLERGVAWLDRHRAERVRELEDSAKKSKANNLDALVHMVLVDAARPSDAMTAFLYRDRNELAVYAKCLFGLTLHTLGDEERLAMVLRNIGQFVVEDDENQTAWLNLTGGYWWYWYGSEFEAHAYYLKLLARTDPRGRTASRLVKYLINNRKHATYWNSTRDTALCIEAMADYIRASGEDRPDLVVEVWLNGEKKQEVSITPENLFAFDNSFVIEGAAIAAGEQRLELRKRGTGPLYFNAYLTNFSLEEYIPAAGLELRVERKFYKLVPAEKTVKAAGSRGQAVDQKVEKYERVELADLATLESGDLVEVELEIESKNDYEYIIFEDMKAAGFEPAEVRSGYNGNDLGAYMELRDDRVSFFVRQLARGRHSVSYRLRAEIPGRFSALPARAYAMYAPELKGNSGEIKLAIED